MLKQVLQKKIYYHDTDCGGVVYYANYLKYCEAGRYEYLAAKGIDLAELVGQGFQFAVSRVDIKYHAPARLGDEIAVYTGIEEVKKVSLVFIQEIRKNDNLLASARVEVACLSHDLKLRKLPGSILSLSPKGQ